MKFKNTNEQWKDCEHQPKEKVAFPYPKISDLPMEEQTPFLKWLTGQTMPFNPETPDEHRYYPWDYEDWKAGKPVID